MAGGITDVNHSAKAPLMFGGQGPERLKTKERQNLLQVKQFKFYPSRFIFLN